MTDHTRDILDRCWDARNDFIKFHIMQKNYSTMIGREDLIEYEELTGRHLVCAHEKKEDL